MSQPIYKRILLKLSGEALQGDEGFGIDPSILDRMASVSYTHLAASYLPQPLNVWILMVELTKLFPK